MPNSFSKPRRSRRNRNKRRRCRRERRRMKQKRRNMRKKRKRMRRKRRRRHRKGAIYLLKTFTPRTFLLTFVVCYIRACASI